ncbi:MAG: hypothetical protein ACLGSH_17145 [Acidobacteriota bacterium]
MITTRIPLLKVARVTSVPTAAGAGRFAAELCAAAPACAQGREIARNNKSKCFFTLKPPCVPALGTGAGIGWTGPSAPRIAIAARSNPIRRRTALVPIFADRAKSLAADPEIGRRIGTTAASEFLHQTDIGPDFD